MADNRGTDDDELSIPRAALNKMIKELVPNVRVANDARELILNCCTEFIHLVSSEANDVCNKQHKKTISPEHTLQGIGKYSAMLSPSRTFPFGQSSTATSVLLNVKVCTTIHQKQLAKQAIAFSMQCHIE